MINQNVEAALQVLNEKVGLADTEQADLNRMVGDVNKELASYQKGLKTVKAKTVNYDIGVSYNSMESRWKYTLLDVMTAAMGIEVGRGQPEERIVKLTGDPYVIDVTTRAYQNVREWMRRTTRLNLNRANKNGEIENTYAWYTTYRDRLVVALRDELGVQKPQAEAPSRKPTVKPAIKGSIPIVAGHIVVTIGGQDFELDFKPIETHLAKAA
jgi:hypothetical protein